MPKRVPRLNSSHGTTSIGKGSKTPCAFAELDWLVTALSFSEISGRVAFTSPSRCRRRAEALFRLLRRSVEVIRRRIRHACHLRNGRCIPCLLRRDSTDGRHPLNARRRREHAAPGCRLRAKEEPRDRGRIRTGVPAFDFADHLAAVVGLPRRATVVLADRVARTIGELGLG